MSKEWISACIVHPMNKEKVISENLKIQDKFVHKLWLTKLMGDFKVRIRNRTGVIISEGQTELKS